MTAPKSFGQIAYEASFQFGPRWPWEKLAPRGVASYERIAAAVALECSRICTEIAAEHMRQARGGDNTGASDYRQQAALECGAAIREAIK